MRKKKILSTMKGKFAKLKFQGFMQKFRFVNGITWPELHKAAALIMIIPFVLQPLMLNFFVLEKVEFSIIKLFSDIPVLNQIDYSSIPFLGDDFFIERINYSVLMILPLFLVSAIISQWLVRRTVKQKVSKAIAEAKEEIRYTEGLDELNRDVLPVWNRQIESARKQSEVAVKDLAKQFGGIAMRLHQAIQASVSYASDGGSQNASANGMISQAELEEMLDTLREAIDVKSVLLEKINQLKDQTNVMKEVVSSVMSVSRKTEVLAINAAIESRRAGEHGRSFGIVAQEVRKLAELAENMVYDVGNRIQLLEQKMDEVIAQTNMKASSGEDLSERSNQTMSLYERFRMLALSLSKSSEILLVESSNIKDEINEILVALQYQDKTSQILIHVTSDIQSLHEKLEKSLQSNIFERVDVEAWMAKLYSTYTMIEEMKAHKDEEIDFTAKEEDDGSSLEFF